MIYLIMALTVGVILGLDQWTKLLTVTVVKPAGRLPGIEGLFDLVYVENTGAAWSSFQGQIWLFCLVFALFAAFIVWDLWKDRMGFKPFEKWCILVIFAGGLGNMIDRLRLGFVVDMIHLEFMDFPVFNVADCFICCGCILLMFHLIFFNKDFWKDEKKHDGCTDSGAGGGTAGCVPDPEGPGADPGQGPEGHLGGAGDPAGQTGPEK